jgi:hypothetical protein
VVRLGGEGKPVPSALVGLEASIRHAFGVFPVTYRSLCKKVRSTVSPKVEKTESEERTLPRRQDKQRLWAQQFLDLFAGFCSTHLVKIQASLVTLFEGVPDNSPGSWPW